MEETTLFNVKLLEEANVKMTLKEVSEILKERGYNPINQLAGYLISGDKSYITSYKGAREKIEKLERTQVLSVVLEEFLK